MFSLPMSVFLIKAKTFRDIVAMHIIYPRLAVFFNNHQCSHFIEHLNVCVIYFFTPLLPNLTSSLLGYISSISHGFLSHSYPFVFLPLPEASTIHSFLRNLPDRCCTYTVLNTHTGTHAYIHVNTHSHFFLFFLEFLPGAF